MGYGDSEKNSRDVIIQTVRLQSKLATSAIQCLLNSKINYKSPSCLCECKYVASLSFLDGILIREAAAGNALSSLIFLFNSIYLGRGNVFQMWSAQRQKSGTDFMATLLCKREEHSEGNTPRAKFNTGYSNRVLLAVRYQKWIFRCQMCVFILEMSSTFLDYSTSFHLVRCKSCLQQREAKLA